MAKKPQSSVDYETKISVSSRSPIYSSFIKGVCDTSLLQGTCSLVNCNLLHLTEPIQLTDGHLHDRLLNDNWASAIEPLKNVERFIGITNIHKASMWNSKPSIVPEHLKSRIQLYETFGIHPRYLGDNPHHDLLILRNFVQTYPMVAIGECGLDLLNKSQLSLQTEIFSAQIKLANEFRLPLILHCRQLDQELFDILRKNALDSSMKIQWHCCNSKGAAVYREFLKTFPSSLLSLGGMCCHGSERNVQRLIKELFEAEADRNQRRFAFETDSPYLKASSLLTNSQSNCPLLGTLTSSAYVTKSVLNSDQWTENLKINTSILKNFFNLQ